MIHYAKLVFESKPIENWQKSPIWAEEYVDTIMDNYRLIYNFPDEWEKFCHLLHDDVHLSPKMRNCMRAMRIGNPPNIEYGYSSALTRFVKLYYK